MSINFSNLVRNLDNVQGESRIVVSTQPEILVLHLMLLGRHFDSVNQTRFGLR